MEFFGNSGATGGLLFDQCLGNSVFDPLASSAMNDIMALDDNNFAFALDSFMQEGANSSGSAPSTNNGWPNSSAVVQSGSNSGMLADCMWGGAGAVETTAALRQPQPQPIGANRPMMQSNLPTTAAPSGMEAMENDLDNLLSEFPDFDNMLFEATIDEKPIMPMPPKVEATTVTKPNMTPTSSVIRNNPLPVNNNGSVSPAAGSSSAASMLSSSSRKIIMKPSSSAGSGGGGLKSRKLLMTPQRPLRPLPIKPRLDLNATIKSSGSPATPLLSSPSPSIDSPTLSSNGTHSNPSSACSSPTSSPSANPRGRPFPGFHQRYKGLPSKKQLGDPARKKANSGSDNDGSNGAMVVVSAEESDDIIRRLKGETNGSGFVPRAGDELQLGIEERRLLAKEGKSLPTHYPLTREQERILKMIRRKIRNKLSAMESRRKKKVYVDCLEDELKRKVEENVKLRTRVGNLEKSNETLHNQLSRLQEMAGSAVKNIAALRDVKLMQANCSTSSSTTSEAAAAAINNIIRRSPRDNTKVKSTYLLALVLSVMLVLPTTFKTGGPSDEMKLASPTILDAEHGGPSVPFLQKLVGRMLNKRANGYLFNGSGKPVRVLSAPEVNELSKHLGSGDNLAHLGLFVADGSPSPVQQKNASLSNKHNNNDMNRNFDVAAAEGDSFLNGWRAGVVRNGIWTEGASEDVMLPTVVAEEENLLAVQKNGSAGQVASGGGRLKVTVIRAKNSSSHDQIIASE